MELCVAVYCDTMLFLCLSLFRFFFRSETIDDDSNGNGDGGDGVKQKKRNLLSSYTYYIFHLFVIVCCEIFVLMLTQKSLIASLSLFFFIPNVCVHPRLMELVRACHFIKFPSTRYMNMKAPATYCKSLYAYDEIEYNTTNHTRCKNKTKKQCMQQCEGTLPSMFLNK